MQERMLTSIDNILSRCVMTYGHEFMRTELLKNLQEEDIVYTIMGGVYEHKREILITKEIGVVITNKEELDIIESKKRFEYIQKRQKYGEDISDEIWDYLIFLQCPMYDVNNVRYKLKKPEETHILTYKQNGQEHCLEYLFISRDHNFFRTKLHPNGDFFVQIGNKFQFTNPVPLPMVKGMNESFLEMEIWADLLLDKESKSKYH